jgi:RNA polymerase sigma-70 factor (ECF subfamily)
MPSGASSAAQRDADVVALLERREHERAFALLLERYEGKIYRLCCALLRDPTLAEDVAQEALLRVWKALGRYDRRASLSTWIYTIARNRCLTALQQRRELASLSDPDIEAQAHAQAAQSEAPPADHLALLREMVETLPERYRRAVTLFYYEERSVAEVAEMLAMPEGTVKTLLFRARALLAEQLEQRGLADASLWLETGT